MKNKIDTHYLVNSSGKHNLYSLCRRGADYLIPICPFSKYGSSSSTHAFFLKRIGAELCISSSFFRYQFRSSSALGFDFVVRHVRSEIKGELRAGCHSGASPFCLNHAWKKAGCHSAVGPAGKEMKRHVKQFSTSHVCNGNSALVVPNVEIRQNERSKR